MKYTYKPILLSLCTTILTGSKCTKKQLDEIKDTHNSITKNHLHNELQKEEPENSVPKDNVFGIKLKNKDQENNIPQSDLANEPKETENEQKKTEPEVEENKLNEPLEKKVPSELEITWKKKMPDGPGHLINFIDFILRDIKEQTTNDSYRPYYLSPESETAKEQMKRLKKHYGDYMEELKEWCLKLPLQAQKILINKIENNSYSDLKKLCMELAPDSKSKKSLADLFIKDINNTIKEFPDFMSNKEILSKMPDNIQKLILDNIKIYKSFQQEGLKNLKNISDKNTGNPGGRSNLFSRLMKQWKA